MGYLGIPTFQTVGFASSQSLYNYLGQPPSMCVHTKIFLAFIGFPGEPRLPFLEL